MLKSTPLRNFTFTNLLNFYFDYKKTTRRYGRQQIFKPHKYKTKAINSGYAWARLRRQLLNHSIHDDRSLTFRCPDLGDMAMCHG